MLAGILRSQITENSLILILFIVLGGFNQNSLAGGRIRDTGFIANWKFFLVPSSKHDYVTYITQTSSGMLLEHQSSGADNSQGVTSMVTVHARTHIGEQGRYRMQITKFVGAGCWSVQISIGHMQTDINNLLLIELYWADPSAEGPILEQWIH